MNWRPAYVALGSNLNEPRRQVAAAFKALARIDESRLVLRSGLWRSAPMGPGDQPDFVNAAAGLLTRLEARMGKTPPPVRWGPRVIDLDLLLFGELALDGPDLRLPHAGLHQRNFVLYPLAEIAPSLWVPGHGRVATLCAQVPAEGVAPLAATVTGD